MPEFPRPQPAPRPLPPAAAISAYRDALLRDAPPEELEPLTAWLDPELVAWLDLFRAAQKAPMQPDPAFVTRLDRIVAAAPGPTSAAPALETLGPPRPSRSHAVNGRHPPIDTHVPRQKWPRLDPRLALGYLATAALLVLVVAAGLYAFGPLRPRPQGIMLGAPDVPGQLAFLWQSTGGPNPLSNAYGVGIDPQGNVWVADAKDRFQIFAPDGTYRETWGTPGSAEGELTFFSSNSTVVRGYGDVAFDTAGNIYVADTGNARIQKFAPDRSFLLAWGSEGKSDGQFLTPSSIAMSPDGTIYVSDEGRHDVQIFDREGRFLGGFGEPGNEEGQFFSPAGIAVDGNGEVWVADYSNKRIQRFTSSGVFLDAWGKPGSRDGEFNNPNNVAVDEVGRVYVADDFNNRVQVFSAAGRFLAKAGGFGSEPGQLHDPLGVAVGADGIAYVSDQDSIQAFRFVPDSAVAPSATSQLDFLWESNGGSDPRSAMSSAYGVGVDPVGNVWVSDDKDRFHIVASDGTFREIWGTPGSNEGEFDFFGASSSVARDYGDVAFDAEGNIYVADTGNARIQKFAPDRTFLLAWGSEGETNGQFLSPSSIAIGADGVVYVGDDARGDIQKFDGKGRYLGTIGEYGTDEGQFFNPSGVAIASNGDVLVADYSNFRIQRFTSSGELLDAWGKRGYDDGEFNQPNDVAVDELGRVYVADDFNYRVQVFSPDGQFLAKAGSYGSDPGDLDDPLGVAVGPDGTAYVSDRNGIQAFRLTDSGGR